MRSGEDKSGKPHFFVDYTEEWFDANWVRCMFWGASKAKRGHTYERNFAQFQVKDEAKAFEEYFMAS